MSSTTKPILTLSTYFSARPTFTDTPPNQPLDPATNSPSVYLYGFLAALILIFLVSVCVAWRGYRTRQVLRARINDAIARGVLVPGYDPENPTLPFVQRSGSRGTIVQVVNRPVMFEEWIAGGEEGIVKPTSLDAVRPYDPPPPQQPTSTRHHGTSPLCQLLETLWEYWFVPPRSGTDPTQLQGRQGRGTRTGHGPTDTVTGEEEQGEKEESLEGVREVRAGVLIAMPDRTHPRWANTVAGYPCGPGGYAAILSGSRPSSWHPPQRAMASGSRPTSFSTIPSGHRPSTSIGTAAATTVVEGERRELPELVLGVVGFGVEPAGEGVGEPGEEKEGVDAGKGKETEKTQPGVIPL